MARTVIYGVPNMTSATLTIPVGKAKLQLEFRRGCRDSKSYRPAMYTSTDPMEQMMIENSPAFGKNIIVVKRYGDASGVTASDTAENGVTEESAEASEEYQDVTTLAQAAAILKAKGLPVSSYRTAALAKKTAQSVGIAFPNLT